MSEKAFAFTFDYTIKSLSPHKGEDKLISEESNDILNNYRKQIDNLASVTTAMLTPTDGGDQNDSTGNERDDAGGDEAAGGDNVGGAAGGDEDRNDKDNGGQTSKGREVNKRVKRKRQDEDEEEESSTNPSLNHKKKGYFSDVLPSRETMGGLVKTAEATLSGASNQVRIVADAASSGVHGGDIAAGQRNKDSANSQTIEILTNCNDSMSKICEGTMKTTKTVMHDAGEIYSTVLKGERETYENMGHMVANQVNQTNNLRDQQFKEMKKEKEEQLKEKEEQLKEMKKEYEEQLKEKDNQIMELVISKTRLEERLKRPDNE
ncbi:hypothetical protein MOUN0_G07888 [Monosporozyma unispora]